MIDLPVCACCICSPASAASFRGHYVLLTGFDAKTGLFAYKDPASTQGQSMSEPCVMREGESDAEGGDGDDDDDDDDDDDGYDVLLTGLGAETGLFAYKDPASTQGQSMSEPCVIGHAKPRCERYSHGTQSRCEDPASTQGQSVGVTPSPGGMACDPGGRAISCVLGK
jgi:hypothetical protein